MVLARFGYWHMAVQLYGGSAQDNLEEVPAWDLEPSLDLGVWCLELSTVASETSWRPWQTIRHWSFPLAAGSPCLHPPFSP